MDNEEACFFFSKYLEIVLISRQYQDCLVSVLGFVFYLNSFVVREYSVYDLNPFSFIEICVTPRIWSLLANIQCALEEKVCSAVDGWNVLWTSVRLNGLGLVDLQPTWSISYRKTVVKSATIIVDLFISPCSLYQFRLHVFWSFIIRCKNI